MNQMHFVHNLSKRLNLSKILNLNFKSLNNYRKSSKLNFNHTIRAPHYF
jgi:hypothetical protein